MIKNKNLLKLLLIVLSITMHSFSANSMEIKKSSEIITAEKNIKSIALSPDNNIIIASFSDSSEILMWSMKDGTVSSFKGNSNNGYDNLFFAKEADKFYTISIKNSLIEQFNIKNRTPVSSMEESLTPFHTSNSGITSEDNIIFVTDLFPPIISEWDMVTHKKKIIIKDYYISKFVIGKLNNNYDKMAINFLNGKNQKGIYIWDFNTAKKLVTLESAKIEAKDINFSNDGTKLISSGESQIFISDVETGKILPSLKDAKGNFNKIYFSYDDKYIIAVSINNKKLSIWDAQTGNLEDTLLGNFANLEVSKNANLFVTSHKKSYIEIWTIGNNSKSNKKVETTIAVPKELNKQKPRKCIRFKKGTK